MSDCIFCEIASGRVPAKIIDEDKWSLSFLDILPKSVGHSVVISKVHAPVLADLREECVAPLFLHVKRLSRRLTDALGADGLTIGINQGEAGGQTVPHLHIHLLPRFENDGGGSVHSIVNRPPKESLDAILKKIKVK